ncbi:MAG: pyridoxal-phosphate dependent enzyme, partial [Calditrichaeota bacterium]
SIAVGVPRDQIKALKAARESGGGFIAVTDEEILEAISLLARRVGILAEPAGATALAGLKKLAETGRCRSDETAAVMVTGHGLKDIEGVMQAVDRAPVVIGNDLEEVKQKVP